jgi:hypothetical protein
MKANVVRNDVPLVFAKVLIVLGAVKADSSLLFDRLTKLNAVHRILMTGTP